MTISFGYWMPLGSGGFVISNIPQRTDWSLDYNARLAQTAEDLGFVISRSWNAPTSRTCTVVQRDDAGPAATPSD